MMRVGRLIQGLIVLVWAWHALDLPVGPRQLLLVFAAVFSAMFKFLPDAEITWRQVSVGGLATSVLFVAGKSLIGLYLGSSAIASFYGAAGSLAVVLVWVYYNAILVLFGAELTRASARWLGERVKPETFAVKEPAQVTPAGK